MAGYLWRYPAYIEDAPDNLALIDQNIEKGLDIDRDIETFLREQGHKPLELLVAGRFFIVLAITLTLAASCWFAARLIGWVPALVGFALIAFDPFHVALSRLQHLDGLLSCLMLLSEPGEASRLQCDDGRLILWDVVRGVSLREVEAQLLQLIGALESGAVR